MSHQPIESVGRKLQKTQDIFDFGKGNESDSQRSSIKSSIIEFPGSREESILSTNTDELLSSGTKKKESATMNLLPEPTPTRFIGRMHQVKEESSKKNVLPPDTQGDPKASSGFATAFRAVGKVKLGDTTRKVDKEENLSLKSKDKPTRSSTKTNIGVAAFIKGRRKSKTKEEPISKEDMIPKPSKDLKPRLFFQKQDDLTDVEILENIGKDEINNEVIIGLDKIAKAASLVKKAQKDRGEGLVGKKDNQKTKIPASILYVGALKGRLAAKYEDKESENKEQGMGESKYGPTTNTRFLGKMSMKKDKHGLYVGSKDSNLVEDDKEEADNPVFLALESVMKLMPQVSMESGESLLGSRTSPACSKVNKVEVVEEVKILEDKVVGELQGGMASVRPVAIAQWNVDKNVRRDRELKPIFIPF